MRTVVTYQHAYVTGEATLCRAHAQHPPEWIPVLGPVQHGARSGLCDVCERIEAEGLIEHDGDSAHIVEGR